ncbi:MAG: protease modulator HflC [Alphaproteobacteria bacterium]|nr:protease modulator HflC [Alphaproteobacteria bacterium]
MSRAFVIAVGAAVVVLGIAASSALFTVKQADQAIVLQFGDPIRVIRDPGLHVKVPFVQNVVYYDKRVLEFDAPAESILGADQKRLIVDSFIRYRIADPLRFLQTVATEVSARARLSTFISGSSRRVFGNVTLSTVLSDERAELMREIRSYLTAQATPLGIEIVDVRLRRVDLPEENSQAIYARMQSERERVAREARARGAEIGQRIRSRADRERTVILAEAQKESEILRGQGDALAVKIYADAYGKGREFFDFYRSLSAYRSALSNKDTTLVLSPESEFFRYFKNVPGTRSPVK